MLKKFILLGVLIYSFHANAQTPAAGTDHGLKITFNAPSNTYCSSSVTSGCIKNYSVSITPPTGATGVVNQTVDNTSDVSGLVTTSWQPGGTIFCGIWSVGVVVNYLDFSGAAAKSSTVTKTFNEPCPLVTNPVTNVLISPIP